MKHERIRRLLDRMTAQEPFKNVRSKVKMANLCVFCDNPNLNFIDALSKREYNISGMCQTCQDNFFKEETKQ